MLELQLNHNKNDISQWNIGELNFDGDEMLRPPMWSLKIYDVSAKDIDNFNTKLAMANKFEI